MYKLHSFINRAFEDTFTFLDTYAPTYRDLIEQKKDLEILHGNKAEHLAAQFQRWAAAHTRKVQDTLENIDAKVEIFKDNQNIVVIDIGCGGGAASTAIVDRVLHIRTQFSDSPCTIHLIGVDPNKHALVIYNQMINNIAITAAKFGIEIKYHIVAKGLPEALPYIAEYLSKLRLSLSKPRLPQVIITQVNVSRPLNNNYQKYRDKKIGWLIQNGIPPEIVGSNVFGEIEAQSYEQLLALSKTDQSLIVTIGTHSSTPVFDQQKNVKELAGALVNTINTKGHKVNAIVLPDQKCLIKYQPNGKANYYYSSTLCVEHKDYVDDKDWEQIISLDNLKLAWARVRASQMRETFVDEFEIRLFDALLDDRLKKLHSLLSNYNYTAYPRLYFEFPKKPNEARPRTLLRLEEEIMLTAVMQVLGKRASSLMTNVFAYRLSNEKSEYFYRPWFRGYKNFVQAVKKYASKVGDDVVIIQVDIKNFYPTINQERLYTLAGEELRALRSDRVMWLLRNLLVQKMEKGSAGDGLGIPQGGIVSGFLANLYLTKIHEVFNDMYDKARLFRYVDDMIIVIHDKADEPEVINTLNEICTELGVSIPLTEVEDKFFKWENVTKFGEDVELSADLNKLGWKFQQTMAHLYLMNEEYRAMCSQDWWSFVNLYREYLNALGIYIQTDRLSRKLNQYVQNPRLPVKERGVLLFAAPLNLPNLANSQNLLIQNWLSFFKANNSNWLSKVQKIKEELSELLQSNWREYLALLEGEDNIDSQLNAQQLRENKIAQKKALGAIRFSVGRLARVGYDTVDSVLVAIFSKMPQLVRNPYLVFEHLALQDRLDVLKEILLCLEQSEMPGVDYLRAIILKAFRHLPNAVSDADVKQILYAYVLHPDRTPVEKLMALETIAALSLCDAQLASELKNLVNALDEPKLIAAIILVIGDVSPELLKSIDKTKISDGYVLSAFDLVLSKKTKTADIFKITELDDLRAFYASAYADGSDEFEDGTSP